MPSTQVENTDTSKVAWEPWIQTVSGKKFHFLSGSTSEVDIHDIALVLSRTPRWAGHTREFLSVGQHSINVSLLVKEYGGSGRDQMIGLLHDATEAYMCDIPSPLKRLIPEFKRIENKVWSKICRAVLKKAYDIPQIVQDADSCMLATEARDLFAFPPIDNWTRRCLPPHSRKIVAWKSDQAYKSFLHLFGELNENL